VSRLSYLLPRRYGRWLSDPADGRRRDAERGSVSIEMVLLMSALFTLLFLGLDAGLYYHARSVAIAAAQEGAREAGSEHGSQASGVAAAQRFLVQAGGPGVIADTHVDGSRSATTAHVSVRGVSMSVLPGVHLRVDQSATVPVERLTHP
jgi:Flp pilus assembly protein TadG